jgi:hypothetical protein
LNFLQKQLKYGLSSNVAIAFFEIGFQARIIASEMGKTFPNFGTKRRGLLGDIKRSEIGSFLEKYPGITPMR